MGTLAILEASQGLEQGSWSIGTLEASIGLDPCDVILLPVSDLYI